MTPGTSAGDGTPSRRVVHLRDASIRLGQFLKLADLVDTGADAKSVLAQGRVLVNGELELRRGRQLVDGDVVDCDGRSAEVAGEERHPAG